MSKFDHLARRLRARVERSASREKSLDWKAADAIDHLQARGDALEAESAHVSAENRALRAKVEKSCAAPVAAPELHVGYPQTPTAIASALTLKEAATLLSVSYSTVYEHRKRLGFFQIGNQWRVWPDTLRERLASTPAQDRSDEHDARIASTAKLPSPRRRPDADYVRRTPEEAEAELDRLLAKPRKKRGP
ncbi:DNA-binding protein [Paraburkholderia kururiensis]|uniref:helix-turn-helix domain-containing protein n=1 Tax=Paraburkholderia kururiensis TaxID=984307 RepID=UPI0039A42911